MKNWKKIKSTELFSSRYFQLRADECENFHGRIVPRYYVVDFPDWVQTVALDKSGRFIMVEQYRYPGQNWFLEFPGGSTASSRDEDPMLAAKRELKEETGYESQNWKYIGFHFPNPALMNNRCHVFLALDCEKIGSQSLDEFEELRVVEVEKKEVERLLEDQSGHHSLLLATYLMVRKAL